MNPNYLEISSYRYVDTDALPLDHCATTSVVRSVTAQNNNVKIMAKAKDNAICIMRYIFFFVLFNCVR